MSKGASQVGTQTSSAIDPLRKEQANYLAGGWQSARNLLEQSPQVPYPGPTYAPGTPEQYTGYGNLYNAGNIASTLNTQAYNPFYAATSGQYGVANSPAYGGLQKIAGGYSPEMQQAAQNANQMAQYGQMGAQTGQQYAGNLAGVAGGVPGATQPYMNQLNYNAATANAGNPAFGLLGQQASGAYLNSNPYIDKMYGSAADAVTRTYQTATAPKTESAYAGSGRYGSPSLGNAVSQNQQNLGGALNNLASNLYGTQYQNERQLQDAAATALGQQYLTGVGRSTEASQAGGQLGLGTAQQQISGYNAAGNQGLAGYQQAIDALARGGALGLANTSAQQQALGALQGGYQSGNAQALAGSDLARSLIQGNITGAQAQTQAGAGYQGLTQAQYDDAQKRYLAQQASPWDNLQRYMQLIGQPTGQSSISQQPIYGSPAAQALGMLGAGSNLLFGQNSGGLLGAAAGGLGGLGGSSVLSGIGSGALPAVLNPAIGAAGLSSLAGMNSAIPALATAGAAWIVCTELMRQGKMPRKHWAAGLEPFAGYPERTKNGYYCWAVPTVRHLRRTPDSRFAKFIGAISCWRAENIAAKRGVRGARWRLRGALVTGIGYPLCAALGWLVAPQDWQAVYGKEAKA